MYTNKSALWNEQDKTVIITLPDEEFEKAKKMNFNVEWEFNFKQKQISAED